MKHRRLPCALCALGLLAGLAGCLPAPRAADGIDTKSSTDIKSSKDVATTKDNGSGPAQDAEEQDSAGLVLGCASDADCQALPLAPCHAATCNVDTGLCEANLAADGADCAPSGEHPCVASATCAGGICVTVPTACDDQQPCTADSCDPASGCTHAPVAAWCDDGEVCTTDDSCKAGTCAGTPLSCDDQNLCTKDSCTPGQGCSHSATTEAAPCDDAKVCTIDDVCTAGVCVGKAKVCNDGNACTIDACIEGEPGKANTGCQITPAAGLSASCSDGSQCNVEGMCASDGSCVGKPKDCDDKNPCTDDSCTEASGCTHVFNSAPCNAGTACQAAGVCLSGACSAKDKDCNDGNACTDDSCKPLTGCQNEPNTAACGDGDPCTEGDVCSAGACKAGAPATCDDGDPCTSDSCDSASGCQHGSVAPGTACAAGKCVAGMCFGATCGDGLCAYTETDTDCEADCPSIGGLCMASNSACISTCTASKCAAPAASCGSDAACSALGACMSACEASASVVACQVACTVGAPPSSLGHYLALNTCRQAFCVANNWIGKKCSGSGTFLSTCMDACESASCRVLSLRCKASSGCLLIRACMQACPTGAGELPCVKGCFAKGTSADAELGADLDACSAIACH